MRIEHMLEHHAVDLYRNRTIWILLLAFALTAALLFVPQYAFFISIGIVLVNIWGILRSFKLMRLHRGIFGLIFLILFGASLYIAADAGLVGVLVQGLNS